MKTLGFISALIMLTASLAFAEGDLKRIPSPFRNAGEPVQQFCPTSVAVKSIGTKNAFKNFTVSGDTAISYQGLVGDTAQNVRVRVGGFTNKTSSGYQVGSSSTIWIGREVTKIGFSCLSTAGTSVNLWKQ